MNTVGLPYEAVVRTTALAIQQPDRAEIGGITCGPAMKGYVQPRV